jgi:hypothetical protein
VWNDFEERGFFLCGMILRREKIIPHKKKPLSSNSFHTKRNLSPQNHSTQKETSLLKIIQHKKKPFSSKSFNTKRNLSPQNHSSQNETC